MKISDINHPKHYNACGERDADGSVKYEPIKVIEGFGLNWGFCLGNALKYILRAPYKGNEREDLEKALWYLERLSGKIGQKRVKCPYGEVTRAWKLDRRLDTVVMRISCGQPRPASFELSEYLREMPRQKRKATESTLVAKQVERIIELENENARLRNERDDARQGRQ